MARHAGQVALACRGNKACAPGIGFHANVGEWISIDAIPRRLVLSAQIVMDVAQGK